MIWLIEVICPTKAVYALKEFIVLLYYPLLPGLYILQVDYLSDDKFNVLLLCMIWDISQLQRWL